MAAVSDHAEAIMKAMDVGAQVPVHSTEYVQQIALGMAMDVIIRRAKVETGYSGFKHFYDVIVDQLVRRSLS